MDVAMVAVASYVERWHPHHLQNSWAVDYLLNLLKYPSTGTTADLFLIAEEIRDMGCNLEACSKASKLYSKEMGTNKHYIFDERKCALLLS